MKLVKSILIILFLSIGFFGCYTILSHPTVTRGEYSQKVKFYNDCSSCHSNSELIDYGYYYPDKYSPIVIDRIFPLWDTPTYTPPWWMDIRIPIVEEPTSYRPNDETKFRNLDGGRTSAPTDFSIPSRNSGSSGSSSSSNSSNNSNSSTNERNSRESNSTKSRDNSGERKK